MWNPVFEILDFVMALLMPFTPNKKQDNESTEPGAVLWKFAGSTADGEAFRLNGLNVWEYKWQDVGGPGAKIKDPIYHQDFTFGIYMIIGESQTVTFAAGEFSNLIWGFFVPAANAAEVAAAAKAINKPRK